MSFAMFMHLSLAAGSLTATPPGDPRLLVLAIIAGTFIHEDIATVATGILVANGVISVGVALPALYIGIVAGDLGLYGMGRLVALNRISRRLAGGRHFSALQIWLDERLVAGVFMVRFLPGLRMPAYTTYGFFAMPFWRFVVSVIFAASIWTTGLFYFSYEFGALTADWLGVLRWPVIVIAAIVPLLAIERIVRGRVPAYVQEARDEPS
jgi:membrane protein DedA with SNARE-associated domain